MLSLAVLAALEFRVQDEPPSEGQMVTGSLSKDMPALPKLPSLGDSEGNKGGVLVPLDNGTLRGSAAPLDMSAIPPDEETPGGKDTPETAAPAAVTVEGKESILLTVIYRRENNSWRLVEYVYGKAEAARSRGKGPSAGKEG